MGPGGIRHANSLYKARLQLFTPWCAGEMDSGTASLRRRRIHPQNRFVQALDQRPAGGGLGLTYQLRPEELDCHVLPAQSPDIGAFLAIPVHRPVSRFQPWSSRSPPAPLHRRLFA